MSTLLVSWNLSGMTSLHIRKASSRIARWSISGIFPLTPSARRRHLTGLLLFFWNRVLSVDPGDVDSAAGPSLTRSSKDGTLMDLRRRRRREVETSSRSVCRAYPSRIRWRMAASSSSEWLRRAGTPSRASVAICSRCRSRISTNIFVRRVKAAPGSWSVPGTSLLCKSVWSIPADNRDPSDDVISAARRAMATRPRVSFAPSVEFTGRFVLPDPRKTVSGSCRQSSTSVSPLPSCSLLSLWSKTVSCSDCISEPSVDLLGRLLLPVCRNNVSGCRCRSASVFPQRPRLMSVFVSSSSRPEGRSSKRRCSMRSATRTSNSEHSCRVTVLPPSTKTASWTGSVAWRRRLVAGTVQFFR